MSHTPQKESCRPVAAVAIDATRIGLPAAQGLYSPLNEHDACGVGFVAISRAARATPSSSRA